MWDVDALRDAMTPEQMDGWMAFAMIEPFGEQWRQAALIAAEIATAGGKPTTPDEYLPGEAKAGPSASRHLTDDQARALCAAKWG